MSANWIDRLEQRVKEADEAREIESRMQLHRADVISQKRERIWKSLLATIRQDAERVQGRFPGDSRMVTRIDEIPPTYFMIHRSRLPSISLELALPRTGADIPFQYKKSVEIESDPEEWDGVLHMEVDPLDNIALTHKGEAFPSMEDVSRFLLEPLFRT